jgi:cyanophycinase
MKRHPAGTGRLFIIGGGEDREHDKIVLRRLVELTHGSPAGLAVLTAASSVPDEMWEMYDGAFAKLGVKNRIRVDIDSRPQANDEALAAALSQADTVFMTGGDQKRLLQLIGGTLIDKAIHKGLRERGACIAGTSAGASAMSEHMLFEGGNRDALPVKGTVQIAAGLGLLRRVVVDQHFSERQRLGRLLSVVAQNPYLLGAGIDEDTALIVHPGRGLEVVGDGAVTVIDGREMLSNFLDARQSERLALTNVKLHVLPSGTAYSFDSGDDSAQPVPASLQDVVAAIASTGPSGESFLPSQSASSHHEDH